MARTREAGHDAWVLRCVALAMTAVVFVGCSDEGNATPPTLGATSESAGDGLTSTTPGVDVPTTAAASNSGDCPNRPAGSAPSQFDAAAGTYSAQGLTLDAGPLSLTFDVVQWLSGGDARRAWLTDHPDDPDGPPNDYYIINISDEVRTAPIDEEATVLVTHLRDDFTASVEADTLDTLGAYLAGGFSTDTYWLTFEDGAITRICEQYRP